MSKKLYALISTLVTVACQTASAFVAYFQPAMFGAIIGAIEIGNVAVNDILLLFVKEV
jgi:hypothetical protein